MIRWYPRHLNILIVLLSPLLAGCMGVAAHMPRGEDPYHNNPWPYPFQASFYDGYYVATGDVPHSHGSPGVFLRLLFLLDLPGTLVVDTLLAPVDLIVMAVPASGATPSPTPTPANTAVTPFLVPQ